MVSFISSINCSKHAYTLSVSLGHPVIQVTFLKFHSIVLCNSQKPFDYVATWECLATTPDSDMCYLGYILANPCTMRISISTL